jgi:hypothetical protein
MIVSMCVPEDQACVPDEQECVMSQRLEKQANVMSQPASEWAEVRKCYVNAS